jgi:hypothetical protein
MSWVDWLRWRWLLRSTHGPLLGRCPACGAKQPVYMYHPSRDRTRRCEGIATRAGV